MKNDKYEGKARYQDKTVAANYDDRRFTSFKGRLTDNREKQCIANLIKRADFADSILDIPCGTGRMTDLLLDSGYGVTGADISLEMLNFARQRIINHNGRVNFTIGDIENLQFSDGSFDLILTIRLLHHIPSDLHMKIFHELHRVTRRWVIISFSNKYSFQSIRRNARSKFSKEPRYSIGPSDFRSEVAQADFDLVKYVPLLPGFSESVIPLLRKKSIIE